MQRSVNSSLSAKAVLQWGGLALLAIFFLPFIYRYLKAQMDAMKSQQTQSQINTNWENNQNVEVQHSEAEKIVKNRPDIWAAAARLAHDLGTAYDTGSPWKIFDERYLTENDQSVAQTLIWQRNNFGLLEKLYQKVYTRGHDLRKDLLKLLDGPQLKQVRKYIKI
jgi:hypothetical protein